MCLTPQHSSRAATEQWAGEGSPAGQCPPCSPLVPPPQQPTSHRGRPPTSPSVPPAPAVPCAGGCPTQSWLRAWTQRQVGSNTGETQPTRRWRHCVDPPPLQQTGWQGRQPAGHTLLWHTVHCQRPARMAPAPQPAQATAADQACGPLSSATLTLVPLNSAGPAPWPRQAAGAATALLTSWAVVRAVRGGRWCGQHSQERGHP